VRNQTCLSEVAHGPDGLCGESPRGAKWGQKAFATKVAIVTADPG
jgi:hypothetical protein